MFVCAYTVHFLLRILTHRKAPRKNNPEVPPNLKGHVALWLLDMFKD